MRTLAVDLGERRVDLALSDEGGHWASPYEVLTVNGVDAAMERVVQVIGREDVKRVVVGLPLNMDDTVGPGARSAVEWGRKLSEIAAVAVVFVDERLSSFEAEQTLSQRRMAGEKLTHKRKKEQRDAVAAAGFLQAFLDGRIPAIDPDRWTQ